MSSLSPLEAYRWLRRLGVSDRDALRALRLARRSVVARLNRDQAVVLVPSQRLGVLSRERTVAHVDLAELLRGGYRVTEARVGRLPEEQQVYPVRVTPRGAECPCPASRLAGDPLCIHKLAAAVKLYALGRSDLLAWLPRAVEEKRRWARLRRRPRRRAAGEKPLA